MGMARPSLPVEPSLFASPPITSARPVPEPPWPGNDAGHLAVGVDAGGQYQATPELLWQAGLSSAGSAVADPDRTLGTPMAESWRLASSISYAFDTAAQWSLDYAWVGLSDMPVAQGKAVAERIGISGKFANAAIHVLSDSITWRY